MAAQIAIRFITENPFATAQELPIKFLVLINSAVPPCIMPLDGQEITDIPIEEAPTFQMLFDIFKADPSDWKDKARPAKLANGRKVCTLPSGQGSCNYVLTDRVLSLLLHRCWQMIRII